MHLARHAITATNPIQVIDARFDADNRIFTTSTQSGFGVYQTWPLRLIQKRDLPNGTLSMILPLHSTSLLFLVGGGRNPLYPPNKVILWDAASGKEVVELEFNERVRGIACRRGLLAVALKRRALTYEVSEERIKRTGEWETYENERGLIALASAPGSTLLVIPGRKKGHIHFVHLPPCPPPPEPSPPPDRPASRPQKPIPAPAKAPLSIIMAHNGSLTTLSVPPSGRLLATTSTSGTLIRIWDTSTGNLVRELRRGSDKAEIYGVAFRRDEAEVCVWSDKGTIHVFKLGEPGDGVNNRQSTLKPISGYFKYFSSQWSYAQYRLPTSSTHISLHSVQAGHRPDEDNVEEEKCVVAWVEVPVPVTPIPTPSSSHSSNPTQPEQQTRIDHQLIALTYTGGWHRLSIPSSSPSVSSYTPPKSPVPGSGSTAGGFSPSSSPARPSPIPVRRDSSHAPSISSSRVDKGKGREKDSTRDKESASRDCVLEEFRRFGRWDGWG